MIWFVPLASLVAVLLLFHGLDRWERRESRRMRDEWREWTRR